jgi:RimJ/RimL family protein N-acetyltransferase
VTDAGRLACQWAFDDLRLARIDWYAEVGNTASRRVAEKIGFIIEGTQRLRIVQRGDRRDAWAGGLLREDLR